MGTVRHSQRLNYDVSELCSSDGNRSIKFSCLLLVLIQSFWMVILRYKGRALDFSPPGTQIQTSALPAPLLILIISVQGVHRSKRL